MSAEGLAFGIDIGGSGVKGAAVDLATGALATDRIKIATPQPATPNAIAETVATLVEKAQWTGPVGLTMPSVIVNGLVRTAANLDPSWIDTDAVQLFSLALGGRPVAVLNDADAAGLAECAYGAARGIEGVTLLLTFGTGIGSALLNNGRLVPNTELGHLEVDGKEAEHRAASSVKERKNLSYKDWAAQVTRVLVAYENLFWPSVFIVGGGISRESEHWIPLLGNRTPVVPATLRNTAGIVGAAMTAHNGIAP
ncbi:polyphosphate--glucose phosphotransferase [Nocardia stercoris]|uniref:ROK family protein n=1 Tax=Nocardia stercoris TaxID=2483361 RepID=A0A3M2KXV4_9NOCA|nr:ROK family protein [Nocardia stercoris]RMI30081.1 ROK family protein [Nocardia stercoris]